MSITRRGFVGSVAAAIGYLGTKSEVDLFAQQNRPGAAGNAPRMSRGADDYDAMAHLSSNENCWGPPENVMKAMNSAWKYANRYGYPDGNIVQELAKHHGVKAENILLTAGSGEVLDVVGTTFGSPTKKVLGVEPSYGSVYQHATSIKSTAIKLPLTKDYRQDMGMLIKAANEHAKELGLVYLCNPNKPTGVIVTQAEVKQLLDGIPQGMPVLIDQAYHHFVADPPYATSVPYVLEGRPVVIARTFSKIAALPAMRCGYAIPSREFIQKMRPYAMGCVIVLVKHDAVASLKDEQGQKEIKTRVINLRKKVTQELAAHGYESIPSETNFFMVSIGREIQPVIQEFAAKKVAVGRPFPPLSKPNARSIRPAKRIRRLPKTV